MNALFFCGMRMGWPARCPDLTNVTEFKREGWLFDTITTGHRYINERINKQNAP